MMKVLVIPMKLLLPAVILVLFLHGTYLMTSHTMAVLRHEFLLVGGYDESCTTTSSSSSSSSSSMYDDDSINFLALGDWGGQGSWPYYKRAQKVAANGMDKVARSIGASFVVSLGDNFYSRGVQNDTTWRFQRTYEDIYHHSSLRVPWYIIAGNHDYEGDIELQLQYSLHSCRWIYPSLYHTQSFRAQNVTLDLVMIDTEDLCKKQPPPPPPTTTTTTTTTTTIPTTTNTTGGWNWLLLELQKSSADYLWVVGHDPPYSICKHGPSACMNKYMPSILKMYGAHYMGGHDHCMTHFHEKHMSTTNTNNANATATATTTTAAAAAAAAAAAVTDPTHYVLSGTGREIESHILFKDDERNKAVDVDFYLSSEVKNNDRFKKATAGFNSFQVSRDQMIIRYHDQRGNIIYEVDPPIRPRKEEKNQL